MANKLLLGAALSLFAVVPIVAVLQQGVLWQHSTYGVATSIALSKDGSYTAVGLQTGFANGSIQLYTKGGLLLWTRTLDRVIGSIGISANGNYVAAGGYQLTAGYFHNGTIYLYDRNGTQLWNYATGYGLDARFNVPEFQVQLSSDGSRVTAATQSSALCFDNHGRLIWSYNATSTPFVHTAASSNASYVAVADGSGGGSTPNRLHMFDSQGRILWNSSAVTDLIDSLAISRDGRYVAVGGVPTDSTGPYISTIIQVACSGPGT